MKETKMWMEFQNITQIIVKQMDIDETKHMDIDNSDAHSDSDSGDDLEEEQINCEQCEYETIYNAYLFEHPTLNRYFVLCHEISRIIPFFPILSHIIPFFPILSHIIPFCRTSL